MPADPRDIFGMRTAASPAQEATPPRESKCPNPHCVDGRVGSIGCGVCASPAPSAAEEEEDIPIGKHGPYGTHTNGDGSPVARTFRAAPTPEASAEPTRCDHATTERLVGFTGAPICAKCGADAPFRPAREASTAPGEPLHDMTDDQADAIVAEVERAIVANRQIGHRGVTLLRTALRYIEKRVGPREAYAIADATFQLRRANTRLEDENTQLRATVVAALTAERDALRSALSDMVEMYVAGVNSGDWGNWNPEDDDEVRAARAALAARAAPRGDAAP